MARLIVSQDDLRRTQNQRIKTQFCVSDRSNFIESEEPKPRGVKIDVLNQYSKLLADKHPDVVPIILRGVGVDVEAKDPRISLSAFLNLNCILEYGVAKKIELIQFWTRVLDPDNVFMVKKQRIIQFFDRLSEGRLSKADHKMFSYSKDVWEFFRLKKLLNGDQNELDINRLRNSMMDGSINIKIFSDIFTIGFDPDINEQE